MDGSGDANWFAPSLGDQESVAQTLAGDNNFNFMLYKIKIVLLLVSSFYSWFQKFKFHSDDRGHWLGIPEQKGGSHVIKVSDMNTLVDS